MATFVRDHGPADHLRQGYGGPPKLYAKAEAGHYVRLLALAVVLAVAPLAAQEGHPLVGTWRGTWGPSTEERHDVTFVMEYDGTTVTGVINPGFESMKLAKVTLDPASWTVRFETETKDKSGKAIPVVIDSKFEDLTNRHRALVGTWTQGATKGDFKIRLE